MSEQSKPRNPPAFPTEMADFGDETGMTLRDWFAGQAMAGIMACRECSGTLNVAQYAYAIADAMLAAREREVAP